MQSKAVQMHYEAQSLFLVKRWAEIIDIVDIAMITGKLFTTTNVMLPSAVLKTFQIVFCVIFEMYRLFSISVFSYLFTKLFIIKYFVLKNVFSFR